MPEEQSSISNRENIAYKIHIGAYADPLLTIANLCRILRQRREYAKNYLDTREDVTKENCLENIGYCNEKIKEILGL